MDANGAKNLASLVMKKVCERSYYESFLEKIMKNKYQVGGEFTPMMLHDQRIKISRYIYLNRNLECSVRM